MTSPQRKDCANWLPAALVLTFAFTFTVSCLSAADPQVQVVIGSAAGVKSDLQFLVTSAPQANLQKEWKNLGETLDSFLPGVDENKPIGMLLTLAPTGAKYQMMVPVSKLNGPDGFLANVKALGYTIKPDKAGAMILQQSGGGKNPPPPIYLRMAGGYAVIAETLAAVPEGLADPGAALAGQVNGGRDVLLSLKNDAADLDERKKSFAEFRKQLEAGVKFKRNEAPADFELRQAFSKHQFSEMERFVVESSEIEMAWTTDGDAKMASGVMRMVGLPGTSMAESAALLATTPSKFAAVTLSESPVLSGHVNFAIDPMRSEFLGRFYNHFQVVMDADIAARPMLSDAGKTAAKTAVAGLVGMLQQGRELGVVDGFLDTHQVDAEHYAFVGAVRTVDGTKATELVEMLPQIRDDWKVTVGAHTHEGVVIHEVGVAPRRLKAFEMVLGADTPKVIYLGVSTEAVWFAAGNGSLDKLKAAITQAVAPVTEVSPTVLTGTVKVGTFLQLLERYRAKFPIDKTGKSKAELEDLKNAEDLRRLAGEAFKGNADFVTYRLFREEDAVRGEMSVQGDLLRFVGSAIADFARKNLR